MIWPHYTIEDRPGRSGKILWSKRIWPFWFHKATHQVVAFHSEPVMKMGRNPFKYLQYKTFTIGLVENNLHIGIEWRVHIHK